MENGNCLETTKPLLKLLKDLANKDNPIDPIVSDLQVENILEKEFNRKLSDKSEKDQQIYKTVLKGYLKNWQKWEYYDTQLESKHNIKMIDKLLSIQYEDLKAHLSKQLRKTDEGIADILEKQKGKVTEKPKKKPAPKLVLEVMCTREQLNTLIYKQPHLQSWTIFNVTQEAPSSSIIVCNKLSMQDLLNWPYLVVKIVLPNFEYTRHNSSHFKRTLVNRKLPDSVNTFECLSKLVYFKANIKKRPIFRRNFLISYIFQVINYIDKMDIRNAAAKEIMMQLFVEIKKDLLVNLDHIHIGAEYQQFLSEYPYVRYLFAPNDKKEQDKYTCPIDMDKFDLALEEVISPAVTFQISKFAVNFCEDQEGRTFLLDYSFFAESQASWLKLECSLCDMKFQGFLNIYAAEQHFMERHRSEMPWSCPKCNVSFQTYELSKNRWYHKCSTLTQ